MPIFVRALPLRLVRTQRRVDCSYDRSESSFISHTIAGRKSISPEWADVIANAIERLKKSAVDCIGRPRWMRASRLSPNPSEALDVNDSSVGYCSHCGCGASTCQKNITCGSYDE